MHYIIYISFKKAVTEGKLVPGKTQSYQQSF